MSTALSVTQLAPSCTDHDLVAAVRRGSDRAFEELYSRYRAPIGSYVLGLVSDHGRAEDIAQEVFISALRRLRDTERPIAFRPWVYEIAKNACIDEFRRIRRAQEVPLDPEDGAEGASRGLHSPAPTPDAAVASRQRLRDLCGAFRGLSESHHRILVLRELEGLSYEQIGARMGLSIAAVESTLFRARRRLGGEYDELVSGRRCERVQTVLAAGGDRSLRSLGIRERGQFARHLAHCQPCRRQARMAGVDEAFFRTPGLAGKIAALLPIPWLPWRSGRTAGSGRPPGSWRPWRARADKNAIAGSHRIAVRRSLHAAAQYADSTAPGFGFGRAAAAVAALAIAGGGLATEVVGHGGRHASAGSAGKAPAAAGGAHGGFVTKSASASSGAGGIGRGGRHARSASGTSSATSVAGSVGRSSPGSRSTTSAVSGIARGTLGASPVRAGGVVGGLGRALGGLGLPSLGLPKGSGTSGSPLPKLPQLSVPSVPPLSVPKLPRLSVPSVPPLSVPKLPRLSVPGVPSVPGVVGSVSGSAHKLLGSIPPPQLPLVKAPNIPAVSHAVPSLP